MIDTFTEFYRATYAGLVAQLYAYCGDLGEAQAQEAYARAWTRWRDVSPMRAVDPDPVERAFAHVYETTTATLVTPDVDVILGRVRRRRTRSVVAGVSATIAVALGLVVTIGPLPGPQTQPAGPPSVSPTSPPFTVSEGMPLIDPTGQVPSGFLESPLLGPASANQTVGPNGEYRSSPFGAQCGGSMESSLTLLGSVGADGAQVHVSLILYLNEVAARAAFTEVAPDLAACLSFPGVELAQSQWPRYGDESVAVTFLMPRDGAGELSGMPAHAVAVRVGRVIEVFLSMPTHGSMGIVPAATPEELDALILDALPRLCVYTVCPRAPELPAPIDHVSPGDRVWLVVLYAYKDGDDNAKPGRGLLAAALAGYRPVLSFQGCDVGANVAVPGREQATAYFALYFSEQHQAEAAAGAVAALDIPGLDPYPKVFDVQVRCSG